MLLVRATNLAQFKRLATEGDCPVLALRGKTPDSGGATTRDHEPCGRFTRFIPQPNGLDWGVAVLCPLTVEFIT